MTTSFKPTGARAIENEIICLGLEGNNLLLIDRYLIYQLTQNANKLWVYYLEINQISKAKRTIIASD